MSDNCLANSRNNSLGKLFNPQSVDERLEISNLITGQESVSFCEGTVKARGFEIEFVFVVLVVLFVGDFDVEPPIV